MIAQRTQPTRREEYTPDVDVTGNYDITMTRPHSRLLNERVYIRPVHGPGFNVVSRSQTVTLAVTVWTTAVERFVLSSPGSRVGDKCERYRKGHESHYIRATPSVEYSMLCTPWVLCNEIHALCGTART